MHHQLISSKSLILFDFRMKRKLTQFRYGQRSDCSKETELTTGSLACNNLGV